MPYIRTTYIFENSIEIEKVFSGRYGRKGNHCKKENPTREEVAKINERNAIKKLRRKMKANFREDDYHLVLTYRKTERPDVEEAESIIKRFLTNVRRAYLKTGTELKYIITTEYKNKAIHHHLIINSIPETMSIVKRYWTRGHPNFTPLWDEGSYGDLAEYLIKETKKTFNEGKQKKRYSCSRNLIEPKKKVEIIRASSFRKEPKPVKGYYLDDVYCGTNEMGYRYQYYTMIKIKRRE